MCAPFRNFDSIFEFLGVFSINLEIFIEKDEKNARRAILCILIFVRKT